MRASFWVAASLILLSAGPSLNAQGSGSAAQAPGQPNTGNSVQQALLDSVLKSWEVDAKTLQSLFVVFRIEEKGDPFNKNAVTASHGEARVLKMPNGQYGLKLEIFPLDRNGQPDRNNVKEKYIFTGSLLYTFDFSSKIITFRKLGNQNMRPDDGPFAFLLGMKANDARKRFTMSISQDDPKTLWFKIVPLTPQDQRDFVVAQLGIDKIAAPGAPKNFPSRIMWREPGGKELSWEFKSVFRNDPNKVAATDFSVENEKKQGWQEREAPSLGASGPNTSPGVPTKDNGTPRK